ncbi:MAG: universal stress protein [Chloroflexi bacterium]|nr:universal stress protein [Chloroflexota bacterium]
MIRAILVPIDNLVRAEIAVRHAAVIATVLGAQVTLLGMMSHMSGTSDEQFTDPVAWQFMKLESKAAFDELVQYLQSRQIQTRLDRLETPAAEALLQYQTAHNFDLVILAVNENDPPPLLRSLLNYSETPIFLAREQYPVQYTKILVPLDGSRRAECVLPLAITLAQAGNGKLLLTHIIHKPEMPRRTALSAEDGDLTQRLIERNQFEAEHYLNDLVSRLPVEAESRLLIDDSITTALHQTMEREQVDLVMFCAHGYSGKPQWPLGGIANNLINYCPVSLVVLQDLPTSIPQSQVDPSRRTNGAV